MQQLKEKCAVLSFPSGTTATVVMESTSIAFSEKRAHEIYELLVELGASPDKITAIGLGYNNNFHIPDILNGRLD